MKIPAFPLLVLVWVLGSSASLFGATCVPVNVGVILRGWGIAQFQLEGDFAFVQASSPERDVIIDVRDLRHPEILFEGHLGGDFSVDEGFLVSRTSGGLNVVDVCDPRNPMLRSKISLSESPSAFTISEKRVYVVVEYDLFVFDVSDPTMPVELYRGPGPDLGLGSHMSVVGRVAYFGFGGCLQIVDLRDLDHVGIACVQVGAPSIPVVTGTHVYVVGGRTLYFVDASDLAAPKIGAKLYLEDMQAPPNPQVTR